MVTVPAVDAVVRIALAAVYCFAAVGKLLGPQRARETVEAFGLRSELAPLLRVLPLVELATAVGLLATSTSAAAGAVSAALLAVFSGVVARALRHGRKVDCNCFGVLRAKEIGVSTLVRNALLFGGSLLVVLSPADGDRRGAWVLAGPVQRPSPLVVLVLATAAAALVVSAAVGRHRRATTGAPGSLRPAEGAHAGEITGRLVYTTAGAATTIEDLCGRSGRSVLVFVDPGCPPCKQLVSLVQPRLGDRLEPVFWVTRGVGEPSAFLGDLPAGRIVADPDGELARACGVTATPSAVAVEGGQVEELAVGVEPVASLVGTVLGQTSPWRAPLSRREVLTAGTVASAAVVLPGLRRTGTVVSKLAARLSGVRCPGCGSCVVCKMPTAQTTKLACRPCRQACSARRLCSDYANKDAAYQAVSAYVLSRGYRQKADPTAAGLEERGSLVYLGLVTELTSSAADRPRAVLTYGLVNSGSMATAALLDARGRVTSVAVADSSGRVSTVPVPVEPSLPAGGPPASGKARGEATLEAASCQDTCKLAWDVAMLALDPLLAGELLTPAGWAFAFATFALSEMGSLAAQASSSGKLVNYAINKLTGQSTLDKLKDKAGDLLCKGVCSTKLEACCDYTGACYGSDALCESRCPGSLKHPLAHCDVYINGVKVSRLIV